MKPMWNFARVAALLLLSFAVTCAAAEGYPSKPIRLIVPFPPGGTTDLVARTMTPRLGELLGQQIVVEYKGGAGGSIGAAEASRAAPDGYTLLIVWDTHGVNHHLYKVQYDFFKSFEPISLLLQSPGILVANPGFPPSTVKELIDYAKANPGKVTYGAAGSGSSNHLSGVLFGQLTGVELTHVLYKGGGPLTTDILGGHVNLVFGSLPLWEQYVRSGKLKGLAVLSRQRIAQLPDLPAASETVPGFEAKTWFALLGPAGTPKDIVARLNREAGRALADAEVKERLTARGFDIVASSPQALAAFLRVESEASGRLIRQAKITAE
jgi:tripartite-type tricarboxylate transporter receptor subunit TctC